MWNGNIKRAILREAFRNIKFSYDIKVNIDNYVLHKTSVLHHGKWDEQPLSNVRLYMLQIKYNILLPFVNWVFEKMLTEFEINVSDLNL